MFASMHNWTSHKDIAPKPGFLRFHANRWAYAQEQFRYIPIPIDRIK